MKFLSLLLSLSLAVNSILIAAPIVFAQDSPPPHVSESSVAENTESETENNETEENSPRRQPSLQEDAENPEESSISTDEAAPADAPADPAQGIKNLEIKAKRFSLDDEEVINQNFVNLLSGSAEIRLPLQVPNGIRGLTPDLTLQYSSQAVHQNSPFGYGWNIELGQIKRLNKNGVNKMYETPIYHVSMGPYQGELILLQTNNGIEEYALRKEQTFAKILYYISEKRWEIKSTDGMTYKFGSSTDSRFQNDDGTRIAAWHVDQILDVMGHSIDFTYSTTGNSLYPEKISYGAMLNGSHPFEILFTSNPRNDYRTNYSQGFFTQLDQIITKISINIQGTEKLRYDLLYLPSHLKSRTDLKTLTLTGTNDQGSVSQDIDFSYYSKDDGFTAPTFHRNQFLKSITFPKGGTISYDYKPSTQFFNSLGGLANFRPHYPLFVVNTVTRSDFTGRSDISNYHYSDGHFFFESVNERELAGFGRVTVTDALNNKNIHFFHQGGGFDGSALGESQDNWSLIGQMYRSESYDPQDNLLQRNITLWNTTSLGNKRFFINQQLTTSSIFNSANQDRSTATSYIYDTSNGNLLEALEHGEVTASNDGSFTDIGNDHRKSVTSYAANAANHMLAFPATQQIYDHNDQLILESKTLYDNLPINKIQYGNVTSNSQKFFEENREISISTSYNNEGQIISSTDALGNTTNISYDILSLFPKSITNSLGHQTSIEYNLSFAQATRTVNPNGMESKIILDGLGRIISQQLIDPNSSNQLITMNSIQYDESQFPHSVSNEIHLDDVGTSADYHQYFDGFGRIIQTRAEDDGSPDQYIVTNTVYDELGRTTSTSLPVFANGSAFNLADGSSILTTTTYDALSRPLSITDANGTTSLSYDIWDTTITDALGNSKTTKSDAFGRLVEVVEHLTTNNQQFSTKYSYDSRDLLVQIENANGNIRGITYDSLGRLVSQEDLHAPGDTDFGVRTYTYDDNGNVLSVTKADGTVLTSTYDALNRVLTQSGPAVNYSYSYDQGQYGIGQLSSVTGPNHTWSGSYDIRGRLISESVSITNDQLPVNNYTKSYTYTRFDQPSTVSFPDGTSVNYAYNNIGQIKDINSSAGGIITHIGYSPLSQVEGVSYGNGLRSVFTYDPNQMYRMTKKRTEPAALPVSFTPLPASGNTVSWSSWINGVVPSAHASIGIYLDPDISPPADNGSGIGTYTDVGISTGNVIDDTGDSGGQIFDITQQSRGATQSARRAREQENTNHEGTSGGVLKPVMTHAGPLGSGNDTTLYFKARYENTSSTASPAVKYQLEVDQNGSRMWNSGLVDLNSPVAVGAESEYIAYGGSDLSVGEATWRITFQLENSMMTPWSDMNVFTVEEQVLTAPSVTFLQDIEYVYDAVGNIVSLIEKSGTAATKTASYLYDDLYRLKETNVTGVTSGSEYTRTQTYGPTGNILSKSDVGSYEYAQLGKTNPQAVTKITNADGSVMNFEYDANGNLTRESKTNTDGSTVVKLLSWDELDRITSIEVTNEAGVLSTVSFVYDQGGRRLSKTISNPSGSKTTLYPFPDYEVTDEGKTKVSVSANNMHLATIESPQASSLQPPAVFFSHTDHLGGGNILTNSAGEQSQTLDYYPFGSIRVDEQYTDFDETKKFTGHEFDDSTGYYYAQARYYHPEIGKFLSLDPWNGDPTNPQSLNKYSYTFNNPIVLYDPTGEEPVTLGTIAVYVIGGAIIGALTNAGVDAGVQYFTSGEVDWSQTWNSAKIGMVEGGITGPVGGLSSGIKKLTLRGGIIVAGDIAGGTIAEIAINDKSFSDAAFQSTFAALAGYGAGGVLGKINAKYGVGSAISKNFTKNLNRALNGETFSVNGKEADQLIKGLLGDGYKEHAGGRILQSADGERHIVKPHTDKFESRPHLNFHGDGKNSHIILDDYDGPLLPRKQNKKD